MSSATFTMASYVKQVFRANSALSKSQLSFVRCFAGQTESSKPSSGTSVNPNVPGLSTNCLKVPSEPVGPGAAKNGEYKNPEYYSYNTTSYFEAEVEMSKFRIPQPSSKK